MPRQRGGSERAAGAGAAERLWTAADVARYFGVHRSTVRSYVAQGLPAIRLSSACVRYDPDEVRAWAIARLTHSVIAPRERAS